MMFYGVKSALQIRVHTKPDYRLLGKAVHGLKQKYKHIITTAV